MRKSTHTDIREALRKMPDGATIVVISAITGLHRDTVRQALPLHARRVPRPLGAGR